MIPAPKQLSSSYPVYKHHVSNFADLLNVDWPTSNFVLFLAADFTSTSSAEIESVASKLIKSGNAYVCAWGNGCEDVDTVWQSAATCLSSENASEYFTMAMSHDDETFEEAAWFALNCTWVDEAIGAETAVVLISVGDAEWKRSIDAICLDADAFNERASEEEGFSKLLDPDNPSVTDEDEYRISNFGEPLRDDN